MTTAAYDLTYEMGFDGDLGNLVSIDAHGHLDFTAAELFLADTATSELYDAGFEECPTFGLEIEHLWRSEHPFVSDDQDEHDDDFSERWTYHYSAEERPDAVAVTRFLVASSWSREATGPNAPRAQRDRRTGELTEDGVDSWPLLCIHHPDEPAVSGISEDRFADPDPGKVIDGNIHYCSPCLAAFEERLRIATEKAWAPERAAEFLAVFAEDVIAVTAGHELRRGDLEAVLHGRDGDASARRRLTAFEDTHRASGAREHRPVFTVQPGYKSLILSDIHHLVEDYTHRSA